jgi:hypothetical protein
VIYSGGWLIEHEIWTIRRAVFDSMKNKNWIQSARASKNGIPKILWFQKLVPYRPADCGSLFEVHFDDE